MMCEGYFKVPACGHVSDRKSTRLNSSHSQISYAVFCLKKKKKPSINSTFFTGSPTPQTSTLPDQPPRLHSPFTTHTSNCAPPSCLALLTHSALRALPFIYYEYRLHGQRTCEIFRSSWSAQFCYGLGCDNRMIALGRSNDYLTSTVFCCIRHHLSFFFFFLNDPPPPNISPFPQPAPLPI